MSTPSQLRSAYLAFFADEERKHQLIPSSPMVPENDPTTLFTGSGMQPMVPYLLGEPHPKGKRIADVQKCFRAEDIEEVGDNRHTTFFEMMGNWSLGDYFKKEQLTWFFTFLTEQVGLDPHKLYVTVFAGNKELGIERDTESVEIWKDLFSQKGIEAKTADNAAEQGMQGARIFFFDEKKNWWSRSGVPANMPVGEPGGPDSEVFYDFGEERDLHNQSPFKDQPCHVNCDCGRFLEIGNSVFMQYQKTESGFVALPQKNVDFGGGLERIIAAAQNEPDIFQTSTFTALINKIVELSGQVYAQQRAFRVIADHVRAAVMLAADGVVPSNKEQGYVSRRLLRRAIRFAKTLGIDRPFLAPLVDVVVTEYAAAYPEVEAKFSDIKQAFIVEEQKFEKTLQNGLKELEKIITANKAQAKTADTPLITPEDAFKLYETYGFPLELTIEIAQELGVDRDWITSTEFKQQFAAARSAHADKSRTASAGKFKGGLQDQSEITTKFHTTTHLLHAALRKVLGTHVQQKGSNITADRLRFDFSHTQALTAEEIQKIETLVNDWIKQDLPVTKVVMQKQQALDSGALAFFVERYPDQVSVYTVGDDSQWVSREFCGGPHVTSTGQIGSFKIIKEKATSAGVRRIYGSFAE